MEERNRNEMHKDPHLKEAREHFRSARRSMYKAWEKWLPEGLLEERRAARKEFLLGMRSMLDYAIEKTEKRSKTVHHSSATHPGQTAKPLTPEED